MIIRPYPASFPWPGATLADTGSTWHTVMPVCYNGSAIPDNAAIHAQNEVGSR